MIFPEGPKEEITTIQCIKFFEELIEPIRQVFEKHGVRLEVLPDRCILSFPEGTTRQIQYPTTQTDRYNIILPDSYTLYEATSIRSNGLSSIRFALDEFPDWVQAKYGERSNE